MSTGQADERTDLVEPSVMPRPRIEWPELAFALFVLVSVGLMLAFPDWQGVPFHLVWAVLTILYAWRQWSPRATTATVAVVALVTGGIVATGGEGGRARILELVDLPMMTLMFLVMVYVVHQRTEALARVRIASEREREFVRDASHQLRTPITIARGHAEMLASIDQGSEEERTRDIEVVLDELTRLQRISDRLILLAAAEHQNFLVLQRVSLSDLVFDAANRWTAVARREWAIDASDVTMIQVDRARIDTALDTLIENAIKATGDGDGIRLRAAVVGGTPVLSVADDGVGVAPEQAERIFERFARGRGPRAGTWGGTGLGLPLVRAIAEAHGGTAALAPSEDDWTTFEIRVPQVSPGPLRGVQPADSSGNVGRRPGSAEPARRWRLAGRRARRRAREPPAGGPSRRFRGSRRDPRRAGRGGRSTEPQGSGHGARRRS